jgi:serine phosphatase RsbU (regulator of sigma subunit)
MAERNRDQISRLDLFSKLTPVETERLLQISKAQEYPAGTVLFRQDDPADRFSLIVNGMTEIILSLGTPEERVLSILQPGDFLGEVGLLHPDQKRTASARILTDSKHFEIMKNDFDALIHQSPSIAIRLAQEMSLRIHKSELATIQDLQEKNRRLERAYQELKEAQVQLIEKERLELELSLARAIQENALVHEIPSPEGWMIHARWQPARTVSGDFYDFFQYGKGRIKFLIADVVGKGIPAALVAATSRSILHTLMTQDVSPGQVLESANNLIFDETPDKFFVTCFYAEIDLDLGWIHYANAGHCLPFWIPSNPDHSSTIGVLKAVGMPLGALPGSRYDQKEALIAPGERLILYSDGLIEAHNRNGEMFGQERVLDYLKTSVKGSASSILEPESLVNGLLNEVSQFIGDTSHQEDDLTCLIIERIK